MNEYEMIQKILETSLQRIEGMINEIKKDLDSLKGANLEYRICQLERYVEKKDNRFFQYLIPVLSSLTISVISIIIIWWKTK